LRREEKERYFFGGILASVIAWRWFGCEYKGRLLHSILRDSHGAWKVQLFEMLHNVCVSKSPDPVIMEELRLERLPFESSSLKKPSKQENDTDTDQTKEGSYRTSST
jgi:hypothetical protein